MAEKITLIYCKECGQKTIHISRKDYDEVNNVSNITHRCLTCGSVRRKVKHHNGLDIIQTPKGAKCANCGNIIKGKAHMVDDTMGMSGDIYYTCNKKCADELIENGF